MNKLTLPEILSSSLLFGLGVFSLWRGIFFTIEQEAVLSDSEFYKALHEVMPIWVWGILMIISSLFLVGACWLMPKRNALFHWALLIGGATCSLMYLLMTSASLFNAINWLTPMQFATLSATCGVIAFFGGAEIYARRK
ncbi:hypothetical protein [Mammaliicoccus fleurettii]|uniref:hypothetical protein n=1 Tax=Mammaliicoccus fleurettii TaxID=150056 RepID=UPI000993FB4B|nr:hypothetical protein [Mammaliicoccus fleurettii]OOV78918.1 hypothetical protein B2G86_00910 [Mammaliicoccus fleurettii]